MAHNAYVFDEGIGNKFPWAIKIAKTEEFKAAWKEEWVKFYEANKNGHGPIYDFIDAYCEQTIVGAEQNSERWAASTKIPTTGLQGRVTTLKNWLKERIEWLNNPDDAEIEGKARHFGLSVANWN